MAKGPGAGITLAEFKSGCEAFWIREPRDAMYRVASRIVKADWGCPADAADGLGVILLTWNQAAYRYGPFDFSELEAFLKRNTIALEGFCSRSIETFDPKNDGKRIKAIFSEALEALKIQEPERRSPVAVAKALHVIAPDFFPLWDRAIAKGRACLWDSYAHAASKYLSFMSDSQTVVASLENLYANDQERQGLSAAQTLATALSQCCDHDKTILKFLDEYYYARFTKKWI